MIPVKLRCRPAAFQQRAESRRTGLDRRELAFSSLNILAAKLEDLSMPGRQFPEHICRIRFLLYLSENRRVLFQGQLIPAAPVAKLPGNTRVIMDKRRFERLVSLTCPAKQCHPQDITAGQYNTSTVARNYPRRFLTFIVQNSPSYEKECDRDRRR